MKQSIKFGYECQSVPVHACPRLSAPVRACPCLSVPVRASSLNPADIKAFMNPFFFSFWEGVVLEVDKFFLCMTACVLIVFFSRCPTTFIPYSDGYFQGRDVGSEVARTT